MSLFWKSLGELRSHTLTAARVTDVTRVLTMAMNNA
jgi:hypothetical protein